MAAVHFYTHETLERIDPTRHIGQRIRRWMVRLVSPRFGHCALELCPSELIELDYDGYCMSRTSQGDCRLAVAHVRSGSLVQHRPLLLGLRMMLAYLLPRQFDNCASFIGRLVYCPSARTPDELYRLLIENKGAMPIQGERHESEKERTGS